MSTKSASRKEYEEFLDNIIKNEDVPGKPHTYIAATIKHFRAAYGEGWKEPFIKYWLGEVRVPEVTGEYQRAIALDALIRALTKN